MEYRSGNNWISLHRGAYLIQQHLPNGKLIRTLTCTGRHQQCTLNENYIILRNRILVFVIIYSSRRSFIFCRCFLLLLPFNKTSPTHLYRTTTRFVTANNTLQDYFRWCLVSFKKQIRI
jgi:hypothetical protein